MIAQRSPFLLALGLACLSVNGMAAESPFELITAIPSVFVLIKHNHDEVAISPDGKLITLLETESGSHELLVLDAATKKILHRLPRACGYSVAFTPDGARLVTIRLRDADWNPPRGAPILHDVNVFDAKTGKLLHTIPLPKGQPSLHSGGIAGRKPFALGDDILVVRGTLEGASVYNLKTGKTLGDLAAGNQLRLASISRDGRWLLTLDGKRDLRVWDVKRRKLERDLPRQDSDVEAACISPDGKWCASITDSGRTVVYDRATGGSKASTRVTQRETFRGFYVALSAAFTADGKHLVATTFGDPVYLPWREGDREPQFDRDRSDLGLRFWDWQSDKPVRRVLAPDHLKRKDAWRTLGYFAPLLMSADGTRFVSSGNYGGVLLLDLKKPDWEPNEEPKVKKK